MSLRVIPILIGIGSVNRVSFRT